MRKFMRLSPFNIFCSEWIRSFIYKLALFSHIFSYFGRISRFIHIWILHKSLIERFLMSINSDSFFYFSRTELSFLPSSINQYIVPYFLHLFPLKSILKFKFWSSEFYLATFMLSYNSLFHLVSSGTIRCVTIIPFVMSITYTRMALLAH